MEGPRTSATAEGATYGMFYVIFRDEVNLTFHICLEKLFKMLRPKCDLIFKIRFRFENI